MDDMNYKYDLTYPQNSTIMLNEKTIKNKIKKKKFIVSDSMYRSNLELQYLVHSRCRHLINQYSTVFTFDNSTVVDKNMYSKFKTHGIELSASYKTFSNIKSNIQIITNVSFSTLEDCKDLVNGNNVSLDEIGFNHIIQTLNNSSDSEFNVNGIYKIMSFINMYIDNVIKYNQPKQYKNIHNILLKIKKEITISEYSNLLCNYFNKNSQWIHFTNFIDLLANKSQSYDKLGYIVMIGSSDFVSRIKNILKFIQHRCYEEGYEDKFWKMLQCCRLLKNTVKICRIVQMFGEVVNNCVKVCRTL
jgi:hypothetical protein